MSTNKGCAPGKSSLIGLGSDVIMMDVRSYRIYVILASRTCEHGRAQRSTGSKGELLLPGFCQNTNIWLGIQIRPTNCESESPTF